MERLSISYAPGVSAVDMGQGTRTQRDTVLQFNEAPGFWCLSSPTPSNGVEFWEPLFF